MKPEKIARNSQMLFIQFNYQNTTLAGCTESEASYSQTIHSYPIKSNTGDAWITSSIATPSPYQYQATPISKLPLATTKSYSFKPTYNDKFDVLPNGVNPPETPETPPNVATPETNSPTRSLVQPLYITAKSGRSTITLIETIITTITTRTSTVIVTYDTENKPIYYTTEIEGEFTVSLISLVETDVVLAIENDATPTKSNTTYMIIGVVAGIALIVVAALIVWFVIRKKKQDDESSSLVEMVEETAGIVPSTTTTVTTDNPLWTTSVVGDNDDPFKQDFDENGIEGYFDVNNTKELE